MTKRVFVTGASGYIGHHAVRALCDAGAEVLVPDRRAETLDPRAERLPVELFDGSTEIFRECGCPDVCLHLAWRDGFRHGSDAHIFELPMHYAFVRDMLRGGLRHFVGMGTMHELGPFEGGAEEDSVCCPDTFYGIAKLALRQTSALLCRQYGAAFQWLRAYYIIGDDAHNRSVFSHLLAAAERGETSFPFTTGRRRFDFIDVEELAAQIAAAVLQDEILGVIECCSGRPVSLGEQAEQFIRAHGLRIRLDYGSYPEPQRSDGAVWGSRRKIDMILKAYREAEETEDGKTGAAGTVGAVSEREEESGKGGGLPGQRPAL